MVNKKFYQESGECHWTNTEPNESEELFKQIGELSPFPIWICDKGGWTEYLNPQFTRTFGYTIEDIPASGSWFKLAYPNIESRHQAISNWEMDWSTSNYEKEVKRTIEVTCKDGDIKTVTVRFMRVGNEKTYMVFHDITEAKMLRENLQKHKDHLEELVGERTAELTRVNGLLQREITKHKRAEQRLKKKSRDLAKRLKELNCLFGISKLADKPGITLEEMLQGTVDLIPFAWQYSDSACARIVLEGREYSTEKFSETPWKQTSNIKVNMKLTGTIDVYYLKETPQIDEGPFHKEERELLDAIAERLGRFAAHMKARAAMKESEEKYSTLVEQATEGVAIVQGGILKFANKAHERITGYSVSEMIGMPLMDIVDSDSLNLAIEKEKMRQAGAEVSPLTEIKVRCKDGSVKYVEASTGTIQYKGKPAAMAVIRDITERKCTEAEQEELLAALKRQNDATAEANIQLKDALEKVQQAQEELRNSQAQLIQSDKLAAVGQLISGVAHELNNPLMAVTGYAELMLKYVEDETIREDLLNLHSDTHRAIGIVRNLLSFARKQEPERRLISVNDPIESVVKLRAYEMNLDNITLETDLAPDLPCTMADFQQLQQIFLNLTLNAEQAIKEAHGKGKIFIRTRENGGMIRITFSDDGPGMPDDIIGKIFDPFFTTKEVGKGTGLGLSICYGLIQEHGGQISVENRPGGGATFIVDLPVVPDPVGCSR